MTLDGGPSARAGTTTVVPAPRGGGFLRQEGRYLGVTLLIVALCAVALAVGVVLVKPEVLPGVGSRPSTKTTQAAQARLVPGRAIAVLDPVDGTENNDKLPNATDGNASTAWSTSTYYNTPNFGNLKTGIGLIIDAGSQAQVRSVELLMGADGGHAMVKAANDPAGTADAWTQVADLTQLSTRTTFTVRPNDGYRYWMVWLTDLPPDGHGHFKASVREVRLRT